MKKGQRRTGVIEETIDNKLKKQCTENGWEYLSDSAHNDEVGGHHDCGCGWNPNGVFCGECSTLSCNGCVNQDATK